MAVPARTIQYDMICAGCGYNLRTLDMDSRCPECGRPVLMSALSAAETLATYTSPLPPGAHEAALLHAAATCRYTLDAVALVFDSIRYLIRSSVPPDSGDQTRLPHLNAEEVAHGLADWAALTWGDNSEQHLAELGLREPEALPAIVERLLVYRLVSPAVVSPEIITSQP